MTSLPSPTSSALLHDICLQSSDLDPAENNSTSEPLYDVSPAVVILLSVCYGSISLLAVLGNGLVIWILVTSRRMRTTTNYFIGNLALADIIIGVFSIPFQFQSALLQRWSLADFMCPVSEFCTTLSVSVSVFTLTAIAVDRYRAVVYRVINHQSRLRAKLIIAAIWCLGLAVALPQALWLRVCLYWDDIIMTYKRYCDYQGVSNLSRDIYFYARVNIQYFLPLVVISFCYCRVGCELWGSHVPGNADNQRDAVLLNNKRKVLKMLVIVVVMFVICWLPYQLYYVLQSVFPAISEFRYINVIFFCFHWLAMANSCCNPFIYGIYNEKFKREFKSKFTKRTYRSARSSFDLDNNGSENIKLRFSLQRSLRGRFRGGSTKTTLDRVVSIPLRGVDAGPRCPAQARSMAATSRV